MSDESSSPGTSITHKRSIQLAPTFVKALWGVWSLTWKGQMTWRRFFSVALGMLVIPVMILITTRSPESWERRHRPQMKDPSNYLNLLSSRLERSGQSLDPAQRQAVQVILTEEFRRTEAEWGKLGTGEMGSRRLQELSDACADRIRARAQPVLNERQLDRLQTYLKNNRVDTAPPPVDPGWDRSSPFYRWLIDVYFFIMLPLNCVGICGALIRDELQANTLSFLTTRPLTRAQLLVAKFISQIAWQQILLLLQALLILAAGRYREIPALGALIPVFLGAQFLAVWAWGALGLFFGQLAKNYMALALVYGVIVELGIGNIPTNINTLSLMFHLKTLLGHNANLQDLFQWPAVGVGGPVGALVLGAAMFLTLAALLFTFREYHHTTEMQK